MGRDEMKRQSIVLHPHRILRRRSWLVANQKRHTSVAFDSFADVTKIVREPNQHRLRKPTRRAKRDHPRPSTVLVIPVAIGDPRSRTYEQVRVGVERCRFTSNVRSRIQVGEQRVAVDRAKRITKYHIE